MAAFCRLQQKHSCCNVTRQCAMALIRRNGMAMEWRSAMVVLRTYTPVFCVLVLSGLRPIAYFVCHSFTSGSFVCSFRYTSLTLYSSLSLSLFVCVCWAAGGIQVFWKLISSVASFANIFSYSVGCLFISFMVSFAVQNF